jgi:hypothetical protein
MARLARAAGGNCMLHLCACSGHWVEIFVDHLPSSDELMLNASDLRIVRTVFSSGTFMRGNFLIFCCLVTGTNIVGTTAYDSPVAICSIYWDSMFLVIIVTQSRFDDLDDRIMNFHQREDRRSCSWWWFIGYSVLELTLEKNYTNYAKINIYIYIYIYMRRNECLLWNKNFVSHLW